MSSTYLFQNGGGSGKEDKARSTSSMTRLATVTETGEPIASIVPGRQARKVALRHI